MQDRLPSSHPKFPEIQEIIYYPQICRLLSDGCCVTLGFPGSLEEMVLGSWVLPSIRCYWCIHRNISSRSLIGYYQEIQSQVIGFIVPEPGPTRSHQCLSSRGILWCSGGLVRPWFNRGYEYDHCRKWVYWTHQRKLVWWTTFHLGCLLSRPSYRVT